jgi:hypothetical protein
MLRLAIEEAQRQKALPAATVIEGEEGKNG